MTDDDVDLPTEQRARIDQVHAALAHLSHYALLGVPHDADHRALGRAYLERTLEFQSTRYFARRLGRYRRMMDAIFAQVTLAYDTLRVAGRRADYDRRARDARLSRVDEMVRAELESMRDSREDTVRERVAVEATALADGPPRTKSGVRAAVTPPATWRRVADGRGR